MKSMTTNAGEAPAPETEREQEERVIPIKPMKKWHELVEEEQGEDDERHDEQEVKDSEVGQQLDLFDKMEEILLKQSADLSAEAQETLRKRMEETMAPIKARSFAHKPKQKARNQRKPN